MIVGMGGEYGRRKAMSMRYCGIAQDRELDWKIRPHPPLKLRLPSLRPPGPQQPHPLHLNPCIKFGVDGDNSMAPAKPPSSTISVSTAVGGRCGGGSGGLIPPIFKPSQNILANAYLEGKKPFISTPGGLWPAQAN